METLSHCYCIILAGGVGRRLWPVSRKSLPKQFIDFFGCGRTLLQQTYERFARFLPTDHIFISTHENYVSLVKAQLPEVASENILPEPVQLNTAPSAIWATWHIVISDPEACVVVSPADQMIQHEDEFEKEIRAAFDYVTTHDEFLAMGVRPTYPNTAYGYIQKGEYVGGENLTRVQSFSEKPEENFARMFVESGEFVWNTGLFLWKGTTLGNHVNSLSNHTAVSVKKLARQMITIAEEMEYVRSFYPDGMPKSIDLLVLEHCRNVVVKECSFGWADVGCWSELREVSRTDADGNAVSGGAKVMFSGTQRCIVSLPQDKKAVIAGLDNYVVAEGEGILLICPNADPDTVRKLINEAQVEL